MNILTLSHFLAKVVYTPEFSNVFHNKVTTSLFDGFKQKEVFFNLTLVISVFLLKLIQKPSYKPYKAIMHR